MTGALGDITNAAGRQAGLKVLGAEAPPRGTPPPSAADHDVEDSILLRSFRHLAVESDSEQTELCAEEEEEEELVGEDAASCATSSSQGLTSPLAAFATAKARLERSNNEADSLISATLQRLRQQVADAKAAAIAKGASSASGFASGGSHSSVLTRLPQQRNVLPQHQRHHGLLLKERLHQTLQLCRALHEQNQINMEKVSHLWADNQRLSRSLHEAKLDKEALQQTIRQLTQEAALLAEQARHALMPQEEPEDAAAAPQRQQRPWSGRPPLPRPAASAATAGQDASLAPDWSHAMSAAASCGMGSRRAQGEGCHPDATLGSFSLGSTGKAGKRKMASCGKGKAGKRKMRHVPYGVAGGAAPADASAAAAQVAGQDQQQEKEEYALFEAFERKWHGNEQALSQRGRTSSSSSSSRARNQGGCRIM